MKNLLKTIMPSSLLKQASAFRKKNKEKRNIRFLIQKTIDELISTSSDNTISAVSLKKIMLCYHVLEKGLTMRHRRNGFGKDVMLQLISEIDKHIKQFGNDNEHINIAIGVIAEYMRVHEKEGYIFDKEYSNIINSFLEKYGQVPIISQRMMTREKFFSKTMFPFDEFSKTRHSLRCFDGAIPIETVLSAIKLAQNAPSACNRQSTRIKIIQNKNLISAIFDIQRGNRGGIRDTVDKLLLITYDTCYWDIISWNGGYIDAGIYAMNLLYALHFYHIGACPLNACFSAKEEKSMRELTRIPKTENFVLFIAIGACPDNFMLANAARSNYNDIVEII